MLTVAVVKSGLVTRKLMVLKPKTMPKLIRVFLNNSMVRCYVRCFAILCRLMVSLLKATRWLSKRRCRVNAMIRLVLLFLVR